MFIEKNIFYSMGMSGLCNDFLCVCVRACV